MIEQTVPRVRLLAGVYLTTTGRLTWATGERRGIMRTVIVRHETMPRNLLTTMDARRITNLMLALQRAAGVTPPPPGPTPKGFAAVDELQDLAEIAAVLAAGIEGEPIDPALAEHWDALLDAWRSPRAA